MRLLHGTHQLRSRRTVRLIYEIQSLQYPERFFRKLARSPEPASDQTSRRGDLVVAYRPENMTNGSSRISVKPCTMPRRKTASGRRELRRAWSPTHESRARLITNRYSVTRLVESVPARLVDPKQSRTRRPPLHRSSGCDQHRLCRSGSVFARAWNRSAHFAGTILGIHRNSCSHAQASRLAASTLGMPRQNKRTEIL